MPPPDDTRNKAEVAAQMAFYVPTHFYKFQKAMTQQLLEWHFQQAHVNPYPFGMPSIAFVDIGAGVGTACLAFIDLLATWTEVLAEAGYRQLGTSLRVVAVEPDGNKQGPRHEMVSAMSSMLDRQSVEVGRCADISSPYPEPDCLQQIHDAVRGASLAVCCMSNFLSSVPAGQPALAPPKSGNGPSLLVSKAVECADVSRRLLGVLPARNRLLLASEVDVQGRILRLFSRSFDPALELLVRRNYVRFRSPIGCYWRSLRRGEQPTSPNWAVNYWSLAHWAADNSYRV